MMNSTLWTIGALWSCRTLAGLVTLSALWLGTAGGSQAADFTLLPDMPMNCVAKLDGQIAPGDADKLKSLLDRGVFEIDEPANAFSGEAASPLGNYEWFNPRLCMNSNGGSLGEGARLARLIAEHSITTAVGPGDSCGSACALAFMAGRHIPFEYYITGVDRVLHPTAKLWFHSPLVLSGDPDRVYSEDDVNQAMNIGLQIVRDLLLSDRLLNMPSSLVVNMLATPAREQFVVTTVEQAQRWQIGIDGYSDYRFFADTDTQTLRDKLSICAHDFIKTQDQVSPTWLDPYRTTLTADSRVRFEAARIWLGGYTYYDGTQGAPLLQWGGDHSDDEAVYCNERVLQDQKPFLDSFPANLRLADLPHDGPDYETGAALDAAWTHVALPAVRGRCRTGNPKDRADGELEWTIIDDEPCTARAFLTAEADGTRNVLMEYRWPSGSVTSLELNDRSETCRPARDPYSGISQCVARLNGESASGYRSEFGESGGVIGVYYDYCAIRDSSETQFCFEVDGQNPLL